MKGMSYQFKKKRRSLKFRKYNEQKDGHSHSFLSRIALIIPLTLLLAISFGPMITKGTDYWPWPPTMALDMDEYNCGEIANWGNQKAEYCIFGYIYNGGSSGWYYIGVTRTLWKNGGLYYHSSIIDVLDASGYYAPGSGSQEDDDPYGYLPRNGQNYEYNSDDNYATHDRLGWVVYPSLRVIELPKTLVPATWYANAHEQNYVSGAFYTSPGCWKQTTNSMRQGVTYFSGYQSPPTYYLHFVVYYISRDFGWWSCYGNYYYDSASAMVELFKD